MNGNCELLRGNLRDHLHFGFFPQGLVVRGKRDILSLCSIQPLHQGCVQVLQADAVMMQLSYFLLYPAQLPAQTHTFAHIEANVECILVGGHLHSVFSILARFGLFVSL